MASAAAAAAHIFMNERRFRELLDSGVITRAERSGYDLDKVREEYITNIREVASGRDPNAQPGDADKIDGEYEKARKDKEMADRLEMQNAVLRKSLLPADEVERVQSASIARARSKLLSIPSKLAPLVVGASSIAAARDEISNAIYDALNELGTARLRDWIPDMGHAGESGVGVDGTAETDGQRVGGPGAKAKRGGVGRARKVADIKG